MENTFFEFKNNEKIQFICSLHLMIKLSAILKHFFYERTCGYCWKDREMIFVPNDPMIREKPYIIAFKCERCRKIQIEHCSNCKNIITISY